MFKKSSAGALLFLVAVSCASAADHLKPNIYTYTVYCSNGDDAQFPYFLKTNADFSDDEIISATQTLLEMELEMAVVSRGPQKIRQENPEQIVALQKIYLSIQ
jgi:hypothetical protein